MHCCLAFLLELEAVVEGRGVCYSYSYSSQSCLVLSTDLRWVSIAFFIYHLFFYQSTIEPVSYFVCESHVIRAFDDIFFPFSSYVGYARCCLFFLVLRWLLAVLLLQ